MTTNMSSLSRWVREYRVISRYRTQWLLALLFLLLAAAATLSVPLAFRDLIDTGLGSPATNQKFINLLLLAAALAITTASRFYVMSWLGERVVADMRQRVFQNVLRQSPAYFETLQTGEVLSRLTSDTTLVQTLVGSSISIALRSMVMLLGGLTMMMITSAWLASVMLALLMMIVLPLWALGRYVRRVSRTSQDRIADTSAMAGEVLNAITTVQAPSSNLLTTITSNTTNVVREPRAFITSRPCQPAPRSRHQRTTIPACERVKALNTPRA